MIRRRTSRHPVPVATCVALLSVFPTVASAVIRTVNADGSGPYPTIQAAYDACSTNDIIELTNGTFTGPGNRELVLHYASVTIRSQSNDPALVILDADGLSLGGAEFNEFSIRAIQFRDTDCLSLFFAGVDFIDCCTGPPISGASSRAFILLRQWMLCCAMFSPHG